MHNIPKFAFFCVTTRIIDSKTRKNATKSRVLGKITRTKRMRNGDDNSIPHSLGVFEAGSKSEVYLGGINNGWLVLLYFGIILSPTIIMKVLILNNKVAGYIYLLNL